jgi:hypothetical protein
MSSVRKINNCFVYNNLVLHNGNVLFVADNEEKLELCALSVGFLHKMRNERRDIRWSPKKVRRFDGIMDLYIDEICFLNEEEIPGHIGHTVFDAIGSQFSCLKQCGINLDEKSEIMTIQMLRTNESKYHDVKGAYQLFFGKPKIYFDELCDKFKDKTVCIKTLVVGSSKKGVSYYDHTYTGNNGYAGAWREFRDYAYIRCKIDQLQPIDKHILYAVTDTNGRPDRVVGNDIEIRKHIHDLNIIMWSNMESLCEQILLLSRTRLYISVDGTNGLNSIFLPDDAIFINLGVILNDMIGYINDYTYAGCDHIKVIYYQHNVSYKTLRINNSMHINIPLLSDMITHPTKYYAPNNCSLHGLNMKSFIDRLSPMEQKFMIFNFMCSELSTACIQFNYGRINGRNIQARDTHENPVNSIMYLYMYHIFMEDTVIYEGHHEITLTLRIQ